LTTSLPSTAKPSYSVDTSSSMLGVNALLMYTNCEGAHTHGELASTPRQQPPFSGGGRRMRTTLSQCSSLHKNSTTLANFSVLWI
jgi:hypothetical protein